MFCPFVFCSLVNRFLFFVFFFFFVSMFVVIIYLFIIIVVVAVVINMVLKHKTCNCSPKHNTIICKTIKILHIRQTLKLTNTLRNMIRVSEMSESHIIQWGEGIHVIHFSFDQEKLLLVNNNHNRSIEINNTQYILIGEFVH